MISLSGAIDESILSAAVSVFSRNLTSRLSVVEVLSENVQNNGVILIMKKV